ncbi:MAG TPA: hypothetical protein VH061_10240 [Solirubrobacteraceae bacterium]|jgi:hypothetical protein|nr:hypothetical protein [Solirubrobacteraceae bacterium]
MFRRPANRPARKVGGRLIPAAIGLAALLFALVGTSAAMAAPKGPFAVFSDCPVTAASACIYAKTGSGKIVIGKENVPIEKAIILQGGLGEGEKFVATKDGNTLSKSPQKVPGGLSGLVKCTEISNFIERAACQLVFENGTTGVTATTELAGPASSIGVSLESLFSATGTALSLPVKVKLENPLLGSSCYIGSNSSPIIINLTTGTSGVLTGSIGEFEVIEGEILAFQKNSLVNGTFSAPAANGCGGIFSFLIDPIVDSRLGLPSASGKNEAVLNGKIEETAAESVIAHS